MKEYRLKWIDWVIVVIVMIFYTYGAFGLAREETRSFIIAANDFIILWRNALSSGTIAA